MSDDVPRFFFIEDNEWYSLNDLRADAALAERILASVMLIDASAAERLLSEIEGEA